MIRKLYGSTWSVKLIRILILSTYESTWSIKDLRINGSKIFQSLILKCWVHLTTPLYNYQPHPSVHSPNRENHSNQPTRETICNSSFLIFIVSLCYPTAPNRFYFPRCFFFFVEINPQIQPILTELYPLNRKQFLVTLLFSSFWIYYPPQN